MMATSAPSAAPVHALKIWVDPRNIYFELTGVNGPSVLTFPRSTAGFASAVAILFAIPEAGEPYISQSFVPGKDGITGLQRSNARETLKRLKII